jgi:hypothetical protein
MLKHPRPADAKVPCNGCTACCKHVLIVLQPQHGDRPELYDTFDCINPIDGTPAKALKQNPDGSCAHLGDHGCMIHGHAPAICRVFDCRRYFLQFPDRPSRRRAVRVGTADPFILQAGSARLKTLELDDVGQ